ncbi:4752_t:CDS:2, partial [Acaulospora colombiana]
DGKLIITYDMVPARRATPVFKNETKKWGEIYIRPDYEPSLGGYEVTVYRERKYFTAYDLLPMIGGFAILLLLIYKLLWGDSRLNPYGFFQKYIFRSTPSISFNQFGRDYGPYNNAIALNRIEKPPSAALKSNGFTKMHDESDANVSSACDSSYPFKGYGPGQIDEVRDSLLESASGPGIGGNSGTNPFCNNQNQREITPKITMEIEGLKREATQEEKCKGLRVVYPARPGITYPQKSHHSIKIYRDFNSNIEFIKLVQLWGIDSTTGNRYYVKPLWKGKRFVAPGQSTRIRVEIKLPHNVVGNRQFFYRIYSKKIEGFADCFIESGPFYIQQ